MRVLFYIGLCVVLFYTGNAQTTKIDNFLKQSWQAYDEGKLEQAEALSKIALEEANERESEEAHIEKFQLQSFRTFLVE